MTTNPFGTKDHISSNMHLDSTFNLLEDILFCFVHPTIPIIYQFNLTTIYTSNKNQISKLASFMACKLASPNPAAQLNLIRWSHPIHQWSTSAWHPSVPPHRRFLRFFNVAGCEKPSADCVHPSIVVYPSLDLGWPSTSLGPLVRCCPNSWWGHFGPSNSPNLPSVNVEPYPTEARRSCSHQNLQPPTPDVHPSQPQRSPNDPLPWWVLKKMSCWSHPRSLATEKHCVRLKEDRLCGCSLQDMVNSCWGKLVFFEVYLVCFLLPGHSVLKWSALPSKPPKTMIRLEGINKGLHVGVPPKGKGMIRKHHAWTPVTAPLTAKDQLQKKNILYLIPLGTKVWLHIMLPINTTQIPNWF